MLFKGLWKLFPIALLLLTLTVSLFYLLAALLSSSCLDLGCIMCLRVVLATNA